MNWLYWICTNILYRGETFMVLGNSTLDWSIQTTLPRDLMLSIMWGPFTIFMVTLCSKYSCRLASYGNTTDPFLFFCFSLVYQWDHHNEAIPINHRMHVQNLSTPNNRSSIQRWKIIIHVPAPRIIFRISLFAYLYAWM